MIIDAEHHIHLPEHLTGRRSRSDRNEREWDARGKLSVKTFPYPVEQHIAFLDEVGIDKAIVTTSCKTLEEMTQWHNTCADLVARYPGRLVGLALIPPLGGEPAFREMERAVKDLGMKGVHIRTRNNGLQLDSPEMWPFYERVSRLGIPIDVHIAVDPGGFDALHAPYALHYIMAREFDMCAATMRLCLGGVLEDFPDLVFVMNHFGGGLSSMIERLDAYIGYAEGPGQFDFYRGKRLTKKPWREYFNKLYFSMAGREGGMETVKCALSNISPRKLLFATDFPMNFERDAAGARKYIDDIKSLGLPAEQVDSILGGNAASVFSI
ncbi:MAG: amidohydrolase family protein [Chloroflexi bacterium]|nr:amidohydrolase family protein [Chloroflexota bacterium]